jgi:hypothetical protein
MKNTTKTLLGLLTVVALLPSCGSGDWSYKETPETTVEVNDTPGTTAAMTCKQTEVWVSANHGHALTIPEKDFKIGEQVTYSLHGTADHDHQVVITDSEFERLKRGETISMFTTGGDQHTHSLTIRCTE